jgi:hypothetical protein
VSSSRLPRWIAAAFVLILIAAAVAWWLWSSRQAAARELVAKSELGKLGALVVMDAGRQYVYSVNLATLQSPESLDSALALLADLRRLQSLHVDGTAFRDEHASAVGRIGSLVDLSLASTPVTDAALEKLQRLSRLDTLYLTDTAVTDAGLATVARLRSLKILNISGTKVSGNLEPLRDLPALKHLVVQQLSLDAASFRSIGEFPALTRLTVQGSTYPDDALQQLINKRPDLTIDR